MCSLARELAQTPKPVQPAIWTDDTTAEALANLLSEQQGRMAVFAPEGGGLFAIMEGRYSNGSNFDVYLKGHAGEPFRVDRRNGASFDVPKATLTLVVTMQRAVLRTFGAKIAELRGRGLLARFLYSLPPSTLGTRNPNPTPLPEYIERAYATAIRELLALRPSVDSGGAQVPHLLLLSPEAHACWISFTAALEPRLGPTGDLHAISDWASKLTGAAVRLAGILHCAREHHQPWASTIARST